MRDQIIVAAIDSLRTEGLKFSVDTIAAKLKISKKTIYKFFPDKETLAYAVYEEYYRNAMGRVKEMEESGNQIRVPLLMVYQDASFMIRSEIFNKYQLNESVSSYVSKLQDELWARIISLIAPSAPRTEHVMDRAIVEGAFENAVKYAIPPEQMAERVGNVL